MRRVLALGLLASVMIAGPGMAAARKPAAKPAAAKPAPKPAAVPAPPPAPAPVLAPAPATPGEPPLFAVFRTVCIEHQGDIVAAEAEARKQGFVTVPPSPDEDPATASQRTVLKRDTEALQAVVFLMRAPPEVMAGAPNGEATLCGVSGPDPAGATAMAARSWVGLPSNSQDGNHLTYLYRQTAEQKLPLADQEEYTVRAAIAASEFRVFDIDPETEGTTLGLMTGLTRRPKPATTP